MPRPRDGGAPALDRRRLADGPAPGSATLQDVVAGQGPLSGPRLDEVALHTAAALAALHRAGETHHDLAPATVLLGPDGAKVVHAGGAARVCEGAAFGTGPHRGPAYLAPEQIEDEPAGAPADVFAWGATLVYAATGRPPFGAGPDPAVRRRVATRRPDLGELEGPLRELLARCLDKDPAARPTARQLVRALRDGREPVTRQGPKRIPRYRRRMMVALALVIAAGFLLGVLI
ncbi:protein kinase [Actinomadura sp. PM05-2]|uniref:non-specific serine/threonine protein kinase n=1 Tax=Actinomadura parmotrematis TaxID=2864039 RepID=A0ABS7FLK2_9ACTN|nr:protein kinase [Actinomadura parmotrematis]